MTTQRILHSNKKRDVILTEEGTERETIIKVSANEALIKAEWEIGSTLMSRIKLLISPITLQPITEHFSQPIKLTSEPPNWTLSTSYLAGETLWTKIANGLKHESIWQIVIQVLVILDHLHKNNIRFTHYDLHVGNIDVKEIPLKHIKLELEGSLIEFNTIYEASIFDYDVSYLEDTTPSKGYSIEKNKIERGIVPSVFDPLFDASVLCASVLYSICEKRKGRGFRVEHDDLIYEPETDSINRWMVRNGFSIRNRGYSKIDVPPRPWLPNSVFSVVRSLFFLPNSVEDIIGDPRGSHKAWCDKITRLKIESLKQRKDKNLITIINQVAMFIE